MRVGRESGIPRAGPPAAKLFDWHASSCQATKDVRCSREEETVDDGDRCRELSSLLRRESPGGYFCPITHNDQCQGPLAAKFLRSTTRHQLHSTHLPPAALLNDPLPSSITLQGLDLCSYLPLNYRARRRQPSKRRNAETTSQWPARSQARECLLVRLHTAWSDFVYMLTSSFSAQHGSCTAQVVPCVLPLITIEQALMVNIRAEPEPLQVLQMDAQDRSADIDVRCRRAGPPWLSGVRNRCEFVAKGYSVLYGPVECSRILEDLC
jgi:hypothetical protein